MICDWEFSPSQLPAQQQPVVLSQAATLRLSAARLPPWAAAGGRRLLGTNGGSLWLWCYLAQPGALGEHLERQAEFPSSDKTRPDSPVPTLHPSGPDWSR